MMSSPSPTSSPQRKVTWVVEVGEAPAHSNAPYEKHLHNSKYEREDVQKKTFAKWMNSQLAKYGKHLVDDLFLDLRDGEILLSLLEILTAQQYKRERGRMRVHHINNVNTAIQILEQNNVRLVNISSNDIVDGNPKLILGLVWSIILHWQVHYHLKDLMSELQQTNLEKTLLAWCRQNTQNYAGVNVKNFTTSWSDGLAFNALIHRWRPHLFDFSNISKKHPNARLEHAFRLAQEHLGIDRLLDPEDVNTSIPDKKSVMMYLMCMFQSLPHSGEDVGDVDVSLQSEPATPLASPTTETPQSRPLSLATNASMELGSYGTALEEVLTWLLDAEDKLSGYPPLDRNNLNDLKGQFYSHERFLFDLTEHKRRLSAVLDEGYKLLEDKTLNRDEINEIKLQIKLLNERWEDLRTKALERQNLVHTALMKSQQQHLNQFRKWLTGTEDRISHMSTSVGGPRRVNAQLNAVMALHSDLKQQQPLVDSLAHAVVVVDGENQESGNCEIEDEVTALGERWTHTCEWTDGQLNRLEMLRAQWDALEHQYKQLLKYVNEKESILKEMEANPATEIGEVLERIKHLQQIKQSMNLQQSSLLTHQDLTSQMIADAKDDNLTSYMERVEALQDRFDALLLIIQVQTQRIQDLGFEVNAEITEETVEGADADFKVTKTTTTTMTVEKTTVTKMEAPKSVEEPTTSKKPRLSSERKAAEFQEGFKVFQNWAMKTEAELEICKGKLESNKPNLDEIAPEIKRIGVEIGKQRAEFSHVEEIQDKIALEFGIDENDALHRDSITEFKTRLENIKEATVYCQSLVNLHRKLDTFYSDSTALEKVFEGYKKWTETAFKSPPTNSQLEQCRNKLNLLKENEFKIVSLQETAEEILQTDLPISDPSKLQSDCIKVNESWKSLLSVFAENEKRLIASLDTTPSNRYSDEFSSLLRKISDVESILENEDYKIHSSAIMNGKLTKANELENELLKAKPSFDYVYSIGVERYQRPDLDAQGQRLKFELDDLITRWREANVSVSDWIAKLIKGIDLLHQFDEQTDLLLKWLIKVNKFVEDSGVIPLGDADLLVVKLDESNSLQEEAETLRLSLTKVNAVKDKILESGDEATTKSTNEKIDEVNDEWKETVENCNRHNENLRRALDKTERVVEQIENFEQWMNAVEEEIPKDHQLNVTDSAGLYQMKAKFQVLKEKCDDRTQEFRNLNETGSDMLLQAEGAPTDLARRFTRLNARWTYVTDNIYERYKVLAEAWHESGELRAWLAREGAWLDGLQRRLRRSPNAPADAEEISDELYDLENYVQNHSDERLSRIQSIGKQLIDAQIMPEWIQAEIDQVTNRWHTLNQQALSRLGVLEEAAAEATRWEAALAALAGWLKTADRTLLNRLQADLTAADLPEDYQRINEEFESQRAVLKEVEDQVELYQGAGKHEAASRLKEQLKLIKESFSDAETQLAAFAASVSAGGAEGAGGLPGRLRAALGALRAVQRDAACLLGLAGADPDAVRGQLRHCLRFYRTLSDSKSEVESVIKTGRKAVEEKTVAEPQDFSKKIDTLKEIYNKLGAQITESKSMLENALIITREMQTDLTSLNKWFDSLPADISKETLEAEMAKMDPIRDKLNSNYDEFAKHCDVEYLEGIKEQIDHVNKRWRLLTKGGAGKSQPVDVFLKDVEQQLNNIDKLSYEKLKGMEREMMARKGEIDASGPLFKLWRTVMQKIEEASALKSNDDSDAAKVEYEVVTDTIKRRLETPSTPDESEKAIETKRTRIPAPLTPSGRSRSSSLERNAEPPADGKIASTFNLSKDSELFSKISDNALVIRTPTPKRKSEQTCRVVEVKEREILIGNVQTVEPMSVYPSDVETTMEFGPQTVEMVEIIEDTETDSDAEAPLEPQTFLVEVSKIQERKLPLVGVLKRKQNRSDDESDIKMLRSSLENILQTSRKSETQTPPPTPSIGDDDADCPLLYDLRIKNMLERSSSKDESRNEYGILDDDKDNQNVHNVQLDAEARLTAPADDSKHPLFTSTPIKKPEPVHVVAVSPKFPSSPDSAPGSHADKFEKIQSPKLESKVKKSPPSPLPKPKTPDSPKPVVPSSPVAKAKSQIPLSKERRQGKSPTSPKPAHSDLKRRFGIECDVQLMEFEEAANNMMRKMDMMLITIGGVNNERDPGKRLEILKNELGSLATDAASLISHGDTLVYENHKKNPLLAEHLQIHYQDKLRNKRSLVMSEIEMKRNLAMKAEDNLKESQKLTEDLQKWLSAVAEELEKANNRDNQTLSLRDDFKAREIEVKKLNDICQELKLSRVGYPEKTVSDLNAEWLKIAERYVSITTSNKDREKEKKNKNDSIEQKGADFVTKVNKEREAVSIISRSLNSHPLQGRVFEEFPQQEDALKKVKASIVEAKPRIEVIEKECSGLIKKCKLEQLEQVKRVMEKLKDEWQTVNKAYKERQEKWIKCQSTWTGLYTNLDQFGEWLEQADRMVLEIGREGVPLKDMKQKQKDLEKQVANKHRQMGTISSVSMDVISRCSSPLSKDIQEQVDLLKDHWLDLTNNMAKLRERISGQETANLMKEGAQIWLQGVQNCLQNVGELLDRSQANPSDDTSLSIRLSLVKAREEELVNKKKDMEVLRRAKQLPKTDQITSIQSQMDKASTNLASHKEYINSKLAALNKYNSRLDAVISWVMETKTRINISKDIPVKDKMRVIDNIMVSVRDREADVNDALENFNNIEKECEAANQPVSAELREKINKLRSDWTYVRARGELSTADDAFVPRAAEPPLGSSKVAATPDIPEVRSSRSSSNDDSGTASRWGAVGRGARARRPSEEASVADIIISFDKSALQIRDWLSVELDMLRHQSVAVGDVDEIAQHIDKQKGVLRELEQKKPQLDELVHTAESLKGADNRQQLHGKGRIILYSLLSKLRI